MFPRVQESSVPTPEEIEKSCAILQGLKSPQEEEAKRKQEEEAKRKQDEEAKRQVDQEKLLLEHLAEKGFTDKQHNTSLLRQMRYDMDHAHALNEHALR